MVSVWRGLVLVGLCARAAVAAEMGSLPDIAKPLLTIEGAHGCDSVDSLKRQLAASPGTEVPGCLPIDRGTRGYFLDEQGDAPPMIELDIRVETLERVLWVPADLLRN